MAASLKQWPSGIEPTGAEPQRRGWFIVFTADSGKVVFTTQQPESAGFATKSFAAQGMLYAMNNSSLTNTVIRGNNTIAFTQKAGLLYCLCCSTPAHWENPSMRVQKMIIELARLCQLLLGPNHDKIAAQMDGFGQGLAKRTFWNINRIGTIDTFLHDQLFDVHRWNDAIPEKAKNMRKSRFKSKVPLGAYMVLRLRGKGAPPICVYESKTWKKYASTDKKIFTALSDGLGRRYSKAENQRQTLVVHSDEDGSEPRYLSLMSIPEEYGTPGLVLIKISDKRDLRPPGQKILNRVAKYSRPAPSILEKLGRMVPHALHDESESMKRQMSFTNETITGIRRSARRSREEASQVGDDLQVQRPST